MQEQMLIYYQIILEKVSFSAELFSSELEKAMKDLPSPQQELLLLWIDMRFGCGVR